MEITPTRSALLESRDDRQVMREGYRFLDEKRLLLASEIMHQFADYRRLHADYLEHHRQAIAALADAVTLHGLHGLHLVPVRERENARIERRERFFFGVPLVEEVRLVAGSGGVGGAGVEAVSAVTRRCADRFEVFLHLSSALAGVTGNLHRLLAEYRRTERRARALEDVILPELDEAIHEMEIRLEELDQEEAIRVRLGGRI
ncbi:MAG: V-type ATP synthase subunit D [Magnetococcales bacterium]|nr:V-type ATP synthase subunit D [Magnetococcales bacterium]